MSALADVAAVLARNGIPHALIGATALAIYGVARATGDIDLLAADPACLDEDVWKDLSGRGYGIDCRRGDADDPLAGVVRITSRAGEAIDVVVGKHSWQVPALARAETHRVGDTDLPVARAADLVLLKLHAGGPQDAWDVDQLLDLEPGLEAEVAGMIGDLSRGAAALWQRILERRDSGKV